MRKQPKTNFTVFFLYTVEMQNKSDDGWAIPPNLPIFCCFEHLLIFFSEPNFSIENLGL